MKEFFNKLANRFKELFGKMEKGKLVRLIILASLIILIIVAAVLVFGRTQYATLYSGMNPADTGEILSVLKEQGVDARPKGTGAVEVPAELVDQLVVDMAFQGYPKSGGNYNYDTFARASGFGTTDIEKETYYVFQLQEMLARALTNLTKIRAATVMITPEKSQSYVIDVNAHPASAMVILTLEQGVDRLTDQDADLIRRLVARSVANLAPENVEITDNMMNDYSSNPNSVFESGTEQEALRASTQKRLEQQVLNLLRPVFGDKVHAAVNVTLNFDRAITESVEFSPPVEGADTGIDVSIKELTETIRGGTGAANAVGQDPNGTAPSYPEVNANSDEVYTKVTSEANREINSIKTQIERAQGQISDLSIAVLLDSSDETVEDYSQPVTDLVSQALGIGAERVTVRRLPLLQVDTEDPAQAQQDILTMMRTNDLIRTGIIAVCVVIVVLLIMMMLRTMFKKAPEPVAQLEGGTGQYVDIATGEIIGDMPEGEGVDAITGTGKSLSREQIENFIERDPEAAAQLLRNWLSDS